MTPRLSGHFSIFGLVFFVPKSLPGISRQWSRETFAILSLKPRSHVRILLYQTWAITRSNTINTGHWGNSSSQKYRENYKEDQQTVKQFFKKQA